jgi:hypothetical protein
MVTVRDLINNKAPRAAQDEPPSALDAAFQRRP